MAWRSTIACATRLLPLLLAFALPAVLRAQFNYTNTNGTITITGYTGPGGAVTIPSTMDGLPVVSIGDYAFSGSALASLTIPASVTNMGATAFGMSCIGAIYFDGNAPSGLSSAFDISTPTPCYYLPGTTGWPASGYFGGFGPFVFLWDPVTHVAGTVDDGAITIKKYPGPGGAVTIPSTIDSLPVVSIGIWPTCNGCTLLHGAFQDCTTLTGVTIGSGITNIVYESTFPEPQWGGAFVGCSGLKTITVDPANPAYSSVDGVLFDKTQTTLIQCPGGRAGNYAIPNGVVSIGLFAFLSCANLASVTLPNTVTNIGQQAFDGCARLTSLYFQGNAPSVFYELPIRDDPSATVYYLPGTKGWGPTFYGLPTALWNVPAQTSMANVGVRNNQFGFNITGSSNLVVVIQASTNLANPSWYPLQTNTLNGSTLYFADPQWTNYGSRFYRVSWP